MSFSDKELRAIGHPITGAIMAGRMPGTVEPNETMRLLARDLLKARRALRRVFKLNESYGTHREVRAVISEALGSAQKGARRG